MHTHSTPSIHDTAYTYHTGYCIQGLLVEMCTLIPILVWVEMYTYIRIRRVQTHVRQVAPTDACVFVCVYAHIYACMHIWLSIMCTGGRGGAHWRCTRCACMHQCIHIVSTNIYIICTHISIDMYMSTDMCHVCINAYTSYLHTYLYICIRLYICIYIHT